MNTILVGLLLSGPTAIPAPELTSLASLSPQPIECRASDHHELWHRAVAPSLLRYCDLMGRGYASLNLAPLRALEAARTAETVRPRQASTAVLRGRAKVKLRDFQGAWQEFQRVSRDRWEPLATPEALHDWAISAIVTAHLSEARDAFRRLLPRASLLASSVLRQRVYLESAMTAMAQGPSELSEAVGLIMEARRWTGPPGFAPVLVAALALALDRSGQPGPARALAGEIEGPRALRLWVESGQAGQGAPPDRDKPVSGNCRVVLPAGELDAMLAVAEEFEDPDQAIDDWRSYLAKNQQGPWAQHALSKIRALTYRSAKKLIR